MQCRVPYLAKPVTEYTMGRLRRPEVVDQARGLFATFSKTRRGAPLYRIDEDGCLRHDTLGIIPKRQLLTRLGHFDDNIQNIIKHETGPRAHHLSHFDIFTYRYLESPSSPPRGLTCFSSPPV